MGLTEEGQRNGQPDSTTIKFLAVVLNVYSAKIYDTQPNKLNEFWQEIIRCYGVMKLN